MKMSHILILVVVLFVGWKLFYHPKFPAKADGTLTAFLQKSVDDDPCAGRERCVFVYMAPWCPACKQTMPIVNQLREAWKEQDHPGLMVVIGNGKTDQLESMAKQVGAPVYLDKEDKFMRATGVRHFPYFIVVDDKKNILASGHSARGWIEKEMNRR
jgi:thiol-disulfide isomerase/thioredoxin